MIKFEPVENSFERFFVEINFKKKRLLYCLYNIVNNMKNIIQIIAGLDQFSTTCDNLILIGDFDLEPEKDNM